MSEEATVSPEATPTPPPAPKPAGPSKEEIQLVADQIADALGETDEEPRYEIRLIVEHYGMDAARAMFDETQAIEAAGGMKTISGKRRRTPGGVFLRLARDRAETRKHFRIFYGSAKHPKQPQEPDPNLTLPVFNWEDRLTMHTVLYEGKGEVRSVKVVLVGRPGKTEQFRDLVVTTMAYKPKLPLPLPKGVPQPPPVETIYTVYIGRKQWLKVAGLLSRPEEILVVEGTATYDPAIKGIAVYATNVITRIGKKQKDGDGGEAADEAETPAEGSASHSAPPRHAAPAPARRPSAPAQAAPGTRQPAAPAPTPKPYDGPPPDAAIKLLAELREEEREARDRLDGIKSLPADEQIGMAAALTDVKRVKDEIKALLQQYPRLS